MTSLTTRRLEGKDSSSSSDVSVSEALKEITSFFTEIFGSASGFLVERVKGEFAECLSIVVGVVVVDAEVEATVEGVTTVGSVIASFCLLTS